MTSVDTRYSLLILISLVILTSGCTQQPNPNTQDNASSGVESPEHSQVDTYKISEVVDGDTIKILNGSSEETVRLLGVDTPEVHKEVEPDDWEGVPDSPEGRQCLSGWGEAASSVVKEYEGSKVAVEFDNMSDRRGYYGRFLAYVYFVEDGSEEERSLNEVLLESGAATVYDSSFSMKEEYYGLEDKAQEEGLGVWGCNFSESSEDSEIQGSLSPDSEEDSGQVSSDSSDARLPLSISDDEPCQYSSVEVEGVVRDSEEEPVEDAEVSSSWHYKSTTSSESAQTNQDGEFSLSRDIGRASTNYEVNVGVTTTKEDLTVSNSTTFTPRSCS